MATRKGGNRWKTLDKDLGRIGQLELATHHVARLVVGMGVALAFIVVAALIAPMFFGQHPTNYVVVAVAAFAAPTWR